MKKTLFILTFYFSSILVSCGKKDLQFSFSDKNQTLGQISLATGHRATSNPAVEIHLQSNKATQQAIFFGDCNANSARWEPFTPSKIVNLTGADGDKKISVLLKDDQEFISDCLSTSVQLDTHSPSVIGEITLSSLFSSESTTPPLFFVPATDEVSGVDHYEMRLLKAGDLSEVAPWTNIGTNTMTATLTGLTIIDGQNYVLEIRAVDVAGNIGPSRQTQVFRGGPFFSVVLTDGPLKSGIYKVRFQLSTIATANITFNYATTDGTAHNGRDYQYTSGAGLISAGHSYLETFLDVRQNSYEGDHLNLSLNISGLTNAAASSLNKTITIYNPGKSTIQGLTFSPLSAVTKISTRDKTTCVIRTDRRVYCWGSAGWDPSSFPYYLGREGLSDIGLVLPNSNADDISVGSYGGCYRDAQTHSLFCWSFSEGVSGTPQTIIPQDINIPNVKSFAVGFIHSCLLRTNGQVYCTGSNTSRNLGYVGPDVKTFTYMFTDTSLEKVVVLDKATCFIGGGSVKCLGDNTSGLLGQTGGGMSEVLHTISGLTQVSDIASNLETACVINAGKVYCWGKNTESQVGVAASAFEYIPKMVSLPADAIKVSVGWTQACAGLVDQRVYCWGRNDFGRLAQSKFLVTATPVLQYTAASAIIDMTSGQVNCVLEQSGIPKCWGGGVHASVLGQVGANTNYLPHDYDLGIGRISKIKSGRNLSCALNTLDKLYCWGWTPGNPENVISDLMYSFLPEMYFPNAKITDFAVGVDHICAIVADTGQVLCAGHNNRGQLGVGSILDNIVATPVTGIGTTGALGPAVGVAVSGSTSCAVLSSGKVYCWGDNYYNQCFSNTNYNKQNFSASINKSPVRVTSLPPNIIEIVGGDASFCSRDSLGEVDCWGSDQFGVLGTTVPNDWGYNYGLLYLTPGSLGIFSGRQHFCGETSQGLIKCWGNNLYGQLGPNQLQSDANYSPKDLGIDPYPNKLVLGMENSCIIDGANKVQCLGADHDGLLGIPSTNRGYGTMQPIPNIEGGVLDLVLMASTDLLALDNNPYNQPYSVATYSNGACALTTFGTLKCWGNFYDGINSSLQGPDFAGISLTPVIPWFAHE